MTERQVEVVGGGHLVGIRHDAVIVVAHGDSGTLMPESATYRAWLALRELVDKAHTEDAERFAISLARLADSWSSGAGSDVAFGIVAPTPDGYQFILRGDVGALVDDGASSETLHGTPPPGAPLSVARSETMRVAVYALRGGASPELPTTRGIGSLLDGVAPGNGAIVWSGTPAAHAAPVGNLAPAVGDGPSGPPAHAEPFVPALDPSAALTEIRPTPVLPPRDPEPQLTPPKVFETFRPDDKPEPRRAPLPISRPVRRDQRPGPPPFPGPGHAHPHPPRPPGPPAPPAPQGPQQPQVRGVICSRGHFNNPDGAFCRQCGIRMNQTKLFTLGPRPPLGFLVLDDGSTITLIRDLVIGREPERSPALRDGAIPIRLENNGGVLSRAHAAIRLVEWDVTVVDLESRNGTVVKPAGQQVWTPLVANMPFKLTPGAEIQFGGQQGRKATFDSPLIQY